MVFWQYVLVAGDCLQDPREGQFGKRAQTPSLAQRYERLQKAFSTRSIPAQAISPNGCGC